MRKLIPALAIGISTASLVVTSPASAAVTVAPINGPNLDTQIHASKSNTLNNQATVFGSTATGGKSEDVTFTANTAVNITENGGGFASIGDANATPDFRSLIINPDQLFTALQFSVQLNDAGFLLVEYSTGGLFQAVAGSTPFSQNGMTLKDYEISGGVFDAIRLTTCTSSVGCVGGVGSGTGFFLEKQNSINLAPGAVPEPGTWAMMLLGFGGMGVAMRRRRRRSGAKLMQPA